MEQVSITIITPTVRPEGIPLIYKALKRQQVIGWQWIIVAPKDTMKPLETLLHPYLQQGDPGILLLEEPPKNPGDVWALNKAYNAAIRAATGELIVSWQDFTYAKPDTLEKLWYHHTQEPKTLVSGVGNKYADDTWSVVTWKDPRQRGDFGTFYPCYFNDIEWNLCSVPKEALYAIGGFDEELDKFYGMDGYGVLDRLNMLGGYDFKLDQTIKSYSLEHGRVADWEEKNAIHGPYEARKQAYIANPKLPYLA